MKSEFKWGIIGPGRIAFKFAEAVSEIEYATVYAIASRSTKDPEKLKGAFSVEKCYDTYEALAADPQVDAIYIATPHRFHHQNVILCLEAGKPVLCEKSFTTNANEAEELVNLSRSKDIFLMEALWTRFLPIYEQVRKWLDAGKIGDITQVTSTLGFVAPRNLEDRLLNIELAGGTVLDLGVYNSALSQWVYQASPQKIAAVGYLGETGIDETVSAIYTYGNGATAQFTCTFLSKSFDQLTISGTKGSIVIHPVFVNAIQATLRIGETEETAEKAFKTNGFEYQIIAAMQAIQKGDLDCPQMTQADTLENMRCLDEIRRQIGLCYPFE